MGYFVLGFNAALYHLSTGTRATWGAADSSNIHGGAAPGSLTEITNINGELTLKADSTDVEVNTRASDWKLAAQGLHDGSVEFTMIDEPTDADLIMIRNAHFARSSIALAVLDGDKSAIGVNGLWADFAVIGYERGEPLDDKLTVKVTVKPTRSGVAPEWVKVTS